MSGKSSSDIGKLNPGYEDEMRIIGFRKSRLKFLLTIVALMLSGGILLLLFTWKKSLRLKATHIQCNLREAEKVLIKDEHDQEFVEKVYRTNIANTKVIYFLNKKIKYVWNEKEQRYLRVSGLGETTFGSLHENLEGLDSETVKIRLEFFGSNSIVVEVKSIFYLLFHEAINPFYIFQLYTLTLWFIQQYYYFNSGIIIFSAISILFIVLENRKQCQTLHDRVFSESDVTTIRDKHEIKVSSRNLVPGDVIVISPRDYTLECDAVLVKGQCIVNESTLTGESVPISKLPIPFNSNEILQISTHKRHILFGGTRVLQTRCASGENALAVVIRTGFSTMKGELVRSILFPKPLDLKFYSDFLRFFIIFIFLGFLALIYSATMWTWNKASTLEIVLSSLDIVTFVVPPLLPVAYTSIVVLSQRRLKRAGIFTYSSKYINMCGGLNVVCFDKTGTLTEDSLDLTAVVPIQEKRFLQPVEDPTHLPMSSPLLAAMATCHNLSLINGQLSGYPLDIKIFDSIDWTLKESLNVQIQEEGICSPITVSSRHHHQRNYNEERELLILKRNPFESSAQCMSVVCRQSYETDYMVFVKGAPEKIVSLCSPNTVPEEFDNILPQYTHQGFRVIAAARKILPSSLEWNDIRLMTRDQLESDLEFLGLIVLQNPLMPETVGALRLLNEADIRTVMVTGDNLLTAISVARESEMVQDTEEVVIVEAKIPPTSTGRIHVTFHYAKRPQWNIVTPSVENKINFYTPSKFQFAIDGKSFDLIRCYNRDFLHKIVHRGKIFARMLPEQKMQLVEILQDLGHQVGMCGDGANDCGALKMAHAGVALCAAEASIAAPFISKRPNINCIPKLIREGRASLVSCFGIFKYLTAYCFCQLFMTLILFYKAIKPADSQYMYIDMALSIIPSLAFGNIEPHRQLVKQRPEKKLLAIVPLVSIFSFLIFQLLVYIITWQYCHAQPWFEPYQFVPGRFGGSPPNYEGTAIFTVSCFSFNLAVVIFSQGPPFRKPLYRNTIIGIFLICSFITTSVLTIYPGKILRDWFVLKEPLSIYYSLVLFGIAVANYLFCYIWERHVIGQLFVPYILPVMRKYFGPFEPYELLEKELSATENWPSVNINYVVEASTTRTEMVKAQMVKRRRNSQYAECPFPE